MMINSILSLLLAGCLLAVGGYLAVRPGAGQQGHGPDLDTVADDELFDGWDGLAPRERKKRLAAYQRRVRARIAEQEREWLRERLREVAEG